MKSIREVEEMDATITVEDYYERHGEVILYGRFEPTLYIRKIENGTETKYCLGDPCCCPTHVDDRDVFVREVALDYIKNCGWDDSEEAKEEKMEEMLG
jgi:hypothetical protein